MSNWGNQGQGFGNGNNHHHDHGNGHGHSHGQGFGQQGQGFGQQGFQNQNQGWNQQGSQQQGFYPSEGIQYKFVSASDSKFVLDCSGNQHDFNNLIAYLDNNQPNQHFTFKNAGNGKWRIFCVSNGLTIELTNRDRATRVRCSQPNK